MKVNIPKDVRDYYEANEKGNLDQLVRISTFIAGREIVDYKLLSQTDVLCLKIKAAFIRNQKITEGQPAARSLDADIHRRTELIGRFKQAVGTVIEKGLGKGILDIQNKGYKGILMDGEYWQEALNAEHYGPTITERLKRDWLRSNTDLTFTQWMESAEGTKALEKVKDLIRSQPQFWDGDAMERHPQTNALVHKVDLNKAKVAYLTEEERMAYKVGFQKSENGMVLLDAKGSPKIGRLVFVMDSNGNVYSGKHLPDQFHHSSFLSAGAVIGAGEFITDAQGVIIEITNKSGHYKPGKENMLDVLKSLADQGFKFGNTKLNIGYGPDKPSEDYHAAEFLVEEGNCIPFQISPPFNA